MSEFLLPHTAVGFKAHGHNPAGLWSMARA